MTDAFHALRYFMQIGPNSRIRSPGLGEKNVGMARIAQNRLNRLVAAESRRINEALHVDGVVCRVWQPLTAGTVCTCKGVANPKDTIPEGPDLGLPSMDDMSGGVQVVARRVNIQQDYNYKSNTNSPLDSMLDSLYESQDLQATQDSDYIQKLLDADSDVIKSIIDDSSYIIGSQNSCSICFGRGFVGGYSLVGGLRLILDNSGLSQIVSLQGFLNPKRAPNSFYLNPNQSIIWSVSLPSYFNTLSDPFIMYDRKLVTGMTISYSADNGTTWVTNLNLLTSNKLDTLMVKVINSNSWPVEFTHLEQYLSWIPNLMGQIGNWQVTSGYDYKNATINTAIVLPPMVGTIDRNSFVADSKYGYLWKLNSINTISTAQNQPVSIECEGQIVRPIETIELLNFERRTIIEKIFDGVSVEQGIPNGSDFISFTNKEVSTNWLNKANTYSTIFPDNLEDSY